MPIKAAVMGLGNIGRYAIEALEIQPDFTCVGVIRRKESLGKDAHDLRGVPEYASLADLEAARKPDVVLLAPFPQDPRSRGQIWSASAITPWTASTSTTGLSNHRPVYAGREGTAVSITAAGWDPGTDSVMRALFEAMAPVGRYLHHLGRGVPWATP
ncbi:MAG: Gfo/Idh/MocA family oxidoreductase [Bilophila wadsworthia]